MSFPVGPSIRCNLYKAAWNDKGFIHLTFQTNEGFAPAFIWGENKSSGVLSDEEHRNLLHQTVRQLIFATGVTMDGLPPDITLKDYLIELAERLNSETPIHVRVKTKPAKDGSTIVDVPFRFSTGWIEAYDEDRPTQLYYNEWEKRRYGNPGKLVVNDK